MPADALDSIEDEIGSTTSKVKKAAKSALESATDVSQKRLNEAIDAAEKGIREAAKRVEKAVRESVDTLRDQAGPYRDQATHQFDEAQKYVVERVKEKPLTATLAGLGVGLLLGLLLASGRSSDK
jgi:ElaB/YqjD/DUF883 family membrane-anchored ribosome-binding protein